MTPTLLAGRRHGASEYHEPVRDGGSGTRKKRRRMRRLAALVCRFRSRYCARAVADDGQQSGARSDGRDLRASRTAVLVAAIRASHLRWDPHRSFLTTTHCR